MATPIMRSSSLYNDRTLAGGVQKDSCQKRVVRSSIAERQRRIQMLLSGKSDAKATENQSILEHDDHTDTDMTASMNDLNRSCNSLWHPEDPIIKEIFCEPEPVAEAEPEPVAEPEPEPELAPVPDSPKREEVIAEPVLVVDTKAMLEFAKECSREVIKQESALPPARNTLKSMPLVDRKCMREIRLHQAMDRVEQRKIHKLLEEAKKIPEQLREERRKFAYQKYLNHGMPTKKHLIKLVAKDEDCDLTKEDIDMLPWLSGNYLVDMAAMK